MKAAEINKDSIEALFQCNDRAVERALLALYERQTRDEQCLQATREHNGVGFSGTDGEFLSSLAERVKKGWGLTWKQMAALRKKNAKGYSKLAKYHRQLKEIAAEREEKEPQVEATPAPAPVIVAPAPARSYAHHSIV